MNMNSTLAMGAASGVLAAKEAPATLSGSAKPEKSVESSIPFTRIRPSLWDAREIAQICGGIIAVLYLLGAVALGAALLFYTFTR
jgi:hypothetical protein